MNPRIYPRFFAVIAVLALAGPLALVAHASTDTSTTTTPLAFSHRDMDTADQVLGNMWWGTHAIVTLGYDVKFARLTGDDELHDGEIKLVLPGGHEVGVWVGLGNDNVILRIYRDGELVKEKEIAHQDCGLASCNEAKGTIQVQIDVSCNGAVTVSAAGLSVSAPALPSNTMATLVGDNDAQVGSFVDEHCAQPPAGAQPPSDHPSSLPAFKAAALGAGIVALALAVLLAPKRLPGLKR
jgi:hypothetical protein